MKKLIISLLVLVMAATSFGAFTNSADNSRATFRNGYAWGGHTPKDKATLWAQEVEAKLEGETATLSLLTVSDYTAAQTLTAAQSGSVITMASTGTGVLTLPSAAVGLHFIIVDGSIIAGNDTKITAASGDKINGGAAAGSIIQTSDTNSASLEIIAITTTSWITRSVSGTWDVI
jgi:hypothetical protein